MNKTLDELLTRLEEYDTSALIDLSGSELISVLLDKDTDKETMREAIYQIAQCIQAQGD